MDTPSIKDLRRRLNEAEETQGWIHHVADLKSGKLLTFPLDRPIAPTSRAERLSHLGFRFDPSGIGGVFGGPSYTLTPKAPYQSFGPASLSAMNIYAYDADRDVIVWWLPQVLPPAQNPEMQFYFAAPNVSSAIVTISLRGAAWPGLLGHVRIFNPDVTIPNPQAIRIPITDPTTYAHTIDLGFGPTQSSPNEVLEIWMSFESGIQFLSFSSIVFWVPPPVIFGG